MEARDRLLGVWFDRARSGQLTLPRFQRHQVWTHYEISSLLEAVIRGLPAGAALILEVGADEQFESRLIEGVHTAGMERATEQLLDGQQRITALFRAFNADYDDRTYFLRLDHDEDGDPQEAVVGVARWTKHGARYPMWADDPAQTHERGLLPVRLLRPGDPGSAVYEWRDAATQGDSSASRQLEQRIGRLREVVTTYNIPFLSLPSSTRKDVALDVFIKLNTSSVNLTPFDIIVAQLEEKTGASLHELVEALSAAVPGLARYRKAADVILDVASLREDRPPSRSSYFKLDLGRVHDEWDELVAGLAYSVDALETERVFDADRLPTITVLPVLAALHAMLPPSLDAAGNARTMVRKYLWRAFCTTRYESSTASRALQDLRGLRAERRTGIPEAPIFNVDDHPLPTTDDVKGAGWPKRANVLARGVLAASLRAGSEDLADGEPATVGSVPGREYHHLFPDSLLTGLAGLDVSSSFRALNCALVTWRTNRTISAKEPLAYLRERVEASSLGETEIKRRLETHLVPYDQLAAAGGYQDLSGDIARARVSQDYERFLDARAALIVGHLTSLSHGRQLAARTG